MVSDKIVRLNQYTFQFPHWEEILRFYHKGGVDTPDGSYLLSHGISVLVKSYATKDSALCRYESHRRTIDLMIGLSGEEYIYWAPAETLTLQQDLAPKDAIKYNEKASGGRVHLVPGSFVSFCPGEAHAVAGMVDVPVLLKKMVVKIPLEEC